MPPSPIIALADMDVRHKLFSLLPRARRFALVLTRSADLADDLVQTALMQALDHPDQLKHETQLDRHFFRTLKTVWLTAQQDAALRRAESLVSHEVLKVELNISAGEILAAFQQLPDEQRELLYLVCVESYSYHAAAEFIGISRAAVMSRLSRSRITLMTVANAPEVNITGLLTRASVRADDSLLCAFADGELDPKTVSEIAVLAAQDPALRHRITLFHQSRDLLQAALSQSPFMDIPPGLLNSAEGGTSLARPRAALASWSRRTLAAAVLLICFGLGAVVTRFVEHGTILPQSGVAKVMHEIAEYHPVYVREVEHLVEVPASQREHIQQWLGERVGLALRAPDLSAYGLTFQGARLIALDGQVLAQLIYTGENGQRIALCVTRLIGQPSSTVETLVEDGLKLRGLSKGEHIYVVVGPADEAVIDHLATDLPTLLVRS